MGVDLIGGSADRQAFIDALLSFPALAGKQSVINANQAIPSAITLGNEQCKTTYVGAIIDRPPGKRREAKRYDHEANPTSAVSLGNAQSPNLNVGKRREAIPHEHEASPKTLLDDPRKRRIFEILPAGGAEGRTRAMLKVQDGCRNFCTYCIIPYTRGAVRSVPVETAAEQAIALAGQGYREIVITGIEIASWGVDLPGKPKLETLLQAICTAVPHLRIRLGSLEPRIITEEFCRCICQFPNLCDHFHLSLQSGSDTVLARMHRKYDTARYLESVALLRRFFPACAITTDMIVAFPGETEEEFAESLAFIRKCDFSDMHIFPYSRRPGTPADKMPGQLCNATKEARSREAIAVAAERSLAYRQSFIGKEMAVLFEEPEGAYFTGHTTNYLKVYTPGKDLHNQLLPVKITALCQDGVLGEKI